jgi:hypothetical protein
LLISSALSRAQLWKGVIAPSRAVDWSNAGIPGGLPDGKWAQCGSTIAAYGTSGSPGSTSAINMQIAGCRAKRYVQLGAGTFYLTGTIMLKNQVAIRGIGANATFIQFYGMGSCGGLYSQFCEAGSISYRGREQNYATWTQGFSLGATSITLSNSLNITAGQTWVILDQQDEAADTGNIWNCLGTPCGGFSGGFARTDDTCSSSVSPYVGYCSQEQSVLVTACSPSCNNSGSTVLTISPGLYMNNWRSSQSTGAWWASTTGYQMGVEDLSADLTSTTPGTSTVVMMNCYQCWTSGIRSIMAARNHIYAYGCNQCQIQYNYMYQSTGHASVSYAVELTSGTSNSLALSNICQQVTDSCPSNTSGGAGNVAAYNLALDDIYGSPDWMQPSDYEHSSGDDFWLREGQSSIGFIADNVHGTHFFTTLFRNYFRGWQGDSLCDGAACTSETDALQLYAASRYFNVIGNVLGQAGYHNNYTCLPSSTRCASGNNSIFVLGYTGNGGNVITGTTGFCANPPACTTFGDFDPLTASSLMRWGNYDTVNAAVRFVSGEVPFSFADTTGSPSIYANPVPGNNSLPNSFFLTGTVATTSTLPCGSGVPFNRNPTRATCEPFPYYGPDVSNGDLGNCVSGTYQGSVCRVGSNQCGPGATCSLAMGGHANLNPAHSCFLDVMGGAPDGTGSVLAFNRQSCYTNDPSNAPAPPTGLVGR